MKPLKVKRRMPLSYKLGEGLRQYRGGNVRYCTLVVTEECNLRCKYCYQLHKNSRNVMSIETAKKAIDFFIDTLDPSDGVVLEFTGGECTLEMDLVREATNYFRSRIWQLGEHPWRYSYMIMISTNGTSYSSRKLQRFLWENRGHIYIGLTIDGTKRKHDMSRIFADGRGSYDVVYKNALLWLRQFPGAITKVTFAHDDLPYVCESVVHLWKMGIKNVAANAVFEDVWEDGDSELYESQLKRLADIAIDEGYWQSHLCNLFWEPKSQLYEDNDRNMCGTGTMVSVDANGELSPCLRFQDFCLGNRSGRSLGTIYDGYDSEVLRGFGSLRKSLQSSEECLNCEMKEQCGWCTALNYDAADSDTIFKRAIFICEMHKARWRANKYYWDRLERDFGVLPDGCGNKTMSCSI